MSSYNNILRMQWLRPHRSAFHCFRWEVPPRALLSCPDGPSYSACSWNFHGGKENRCRRCLSGRGHPLLEVEACWDERKTTDLFSLQVHSSLMLIVDSRETRNIARRCTSHLAGDTRPTYRLSGSNPLTMLTDNVPVRVCIDQQCWRKLLQH